MSLPEWPDPDRRGAALDWVMLDVAGYRPPPEMPSPAELDVLRCYSVGLTEPMVADTLGQTRDRVMKLTASARRRLAAKNTAHAVAICLRSGYLT